MVRSPLTAPSLSWVPTIQKTEPCLGDIRGGRVEAHFHGRFAAGLRKFQHSDFANFYASILHEGSLFLQSIGILEINRYGWPGENDVLADIPGAQQRGCNGNEPESQLRGLLPIFALGSECVVSFIMLFLFWRIPVQARIKTQRRQQRQHDAPPRRKRRRVPDAPWPLRPVRSWRRKSRARKPQACSRDQ